MHKHVCMSDLQEPLGAVLCISSKARLAPVTTPGVSVNCRRLCSRLGKNKRNILVCIMWSLILALRPGSTAGPAAVAT
jgi:hypothetical protein